MSVVLISSAWSFSSSNRHCVVPGVQSQHQLSNFQQSFVGDHMTFVSDNNKNAQISQSFSRSSRSHSKSSATAISMSMTSMTNNIPPNVIPTIISALAVAGVIAFHEAGHFFAAKWQGMKIQSYNIGYGPKLLSFNDSSDTE